MAQEPPLAARQAPEPDAPDADALHPGHVGVHGLEEAPDLPVPGLVDDEPDLHPILQSRLKQEGFETLNAFNGETALQLVRDEHPDAVIVDVVLPGMNGFEVCRKIKQEFPEIKVIVYTAKVDAVDAGKAKESGADLFTVKTNSLVLLLASIKRIVAY